MNASLCLQGRENGQSGPEICMGLCDRHGLKLYRTSLHVGPWITAQGVAKLQCELVRRVARCCLPERELVLAHGFRALRRNRRCNTVVFGDPSLHPFARWVSYVGFDTHETAVIYGNRLLLL